MSDQKITPFLWFDDNAEEAVQFYVDVFRDATIGEISRYGENGPRPAGSAMVVPFTLFGQDFLALNGGPEYTFSPAISFVVNCETQAEIDDRWEKLTAGGRPMQCGWLTDKYGVTWQIVPSQLPELLDNDDPERANRVMQALLGMIKLDLGALRAAYENREPAERRS
jgi:predicted 3-demethylubiquinone-9 3-methyltransferase (glyoxalase superfamily)